MAMVNYLSRFEVWRKSAEARRRRERRGRGETGVFVACWCAEDWRRELQGKV